MFSNANTLWRRIAPLVAFIALALVLGCIVPPTVHVIRPHNTIEGLEGKRPRVFMRYHPMNYFDHIVSINPPGGRMHLDIGGALSESYREGLDGFFSVVRYLQYSDYVANVDMNTIEVKVGYEVSADNATVEVDVSLKHVFAVRFLFDNAVEHLVKVEARASRVVPMGDREHLGRETARIVQDMLPDIERRIYENLLASDEPGKYIRQ
ncbi:MAG: hypothetical protein KAR83_04555 [Thermodesulfovibrionales bacterium]|nr:hypothetical protein [Thermodesulfovibrionales bacterium]